MSGKRVVWQVTVRKVYCFRGIIIKYKPSATIRRIEGSVLS